MSGVKDMKNIISRYLSPFSIFVIFTLLGFAGYLFYAVRYGAVMAFYPNNAYRYTLAYLSIPFIMLFTEEKSGRAGTFEFVETVLFSLVYAMPVLYGKVKKFHISRDIYIYACRKMDLFLCVLFTGGYDHS